MEDIPADLAFAIDHAHRIISWQENLVNEEMPPRWMWHLEWELDEWFENVDQKRKDRYGDPDDREQTELMSNQDPEVKERFKR